MNPESHEEGRSPAPRGLWRGCLAWVVFSLLALALRGLRWDENFEFAQCMVGRVPYPEGHPLPFYTLGVYNLQFYSSAAIVWLTPDPAVLCAFRNALFILSTVIPVFLLAALLSRQVLVGHVATVLFLAGIHLEFDGAYPQFLWPGMFSNGHIGVAYTLLLMCMLVGGYTRWAALLFGLMPAIHLGQMPPVLWLVGFHVIWRGWRGELKQLLPAAPYCAAGFAFCVLFYFVNRHFAIPPPTEGPYFSSAEARPLWMGHVLHHDMHRSIPVGNSHLIALAMLLLGGAGFRAKTDSEALRYAWRWMCVYAAGVIAIVYGIMTIHLLMGPWIPYLLLGWLPYRLANHLPPILLAMMLTVLVGAPPRGSQKRSPTTWIVLGALVYLLGRSGLSAVVEPEVYSRYFSMTENVFFGFFGAALAVLLFRMRADWRFVIPWSLLSIAAWCLVLKMHQYGAACLLLGASIGLALEWGAARGAETRVEQVGRILVRPALAILTILFVILILRTELANRKHLPVGEFEARVAQYLSDSGEEDAMIVGAAYQLLLQAQTGHPVMVDMATGFLTGYMPSLAPSVQNIFRDIYGIYFEKPLAGPGAQPSWDQTWAKRSAEEWRRLGEKYDFRYVVGPEPLPLNLEPIFSGEMDTFYRIPSS